MLKALAEQAPDHPLLVVFLPYLEDDLARLRAEAPAAYRGIEQSGLPQSSRARLLAVLVSWYVTRFTQLNHREVMQMFNFQGALEDSLAWREMMAIGRGEGEEIGRKREARLVSRQLHRRLGKKLPKKYEDQVLALSVDDLETLGEALLDFTALADLEAWLGQRAEALSHEQIHEPIKETHAH